jgi:hypothetical protein
VALQKETESHLADGAENSEEPQLNLNLPAKDVGNDKGFSQVIGSSAGCQPLQRFLRARGKRLKPLVLAAGAPAPG